MRVNDNYACSLAFLRNSGTTCPLAGLHEYLLLYINLYNVHIVNGLGTNQLFVRCTTD